MQDLNNKYVLNLIEASHNGSKNSYLQLCELILKDIFALCLLLTADADSARELTKKVFITAWNNLKQIRDNASFNAWLRAFAVSFVLEELRKNSRETKKRNQQKTEHWMKVRSGKIGKFILSLDELERTARVLYDIMNYSYDEIKDLLWHLPDVNIVELVRGARKKYFLDSL